MSSIFNLNNDLLELLDEVEELEGELTDELADRLKINEEDFKAKAESYAYAITELKGQVATLNEYKDKVAAKIKAKENLIERLRENVKLAITAYGTIQNNKDGTFKNRVYKTATFSMYTTYSKPVVLSDDFYHKDYAKFTPKLKNLNDEAFMKFKSLVEGKGLEYEYEVSIDKKAIKADLQEGKKIKGAYIDNDAHFVTIR